MRAVPAVGGRRGAVKDISGPFVALTVAPSLLLYSRLHLHDTNGRPLGSALPLAISDGQEGGGSNDEKANNTKYFMEGDKKSWCFKKSFCKQLDIAVYKRKVYIP